MLSRARGHFSRHLRLRCGFRRWDAHISSTNGKADGIGGGSVEHEIGEFGVAVLEAFGEIVEVRHRIPVSIEPPTQAVLVADEDDPERLIPDEREDRKRLTLAGAEQIHRHPWTRQVADREIRGRALRTEPNDRAEQR